MFIPYNEKDRAPHQSLFSTKRVSLAFPLRAANHAKQEVEADNGEVDILSGMMEGDTTGSFVIPDTGVTEGVYSPVIQDGAVCEAAVEFALGRYSPYPGVGNDIFPPYSFSMKCDYDVSDLLIGNGTRTGQEAAREIQKSFSAMAFPLVESVNSSAAQRNLTGAPIWILAVWRLRSGEYCFAGPPVLMVPDSELPRLTVDSVRNVDGGYYVSGRFVQRFCKLFCRISKAESLPEEIAGCDLFVSHQCQRLHDTATGEFGSVDTAVFSHSGIINENGELSDVKPRRIDASLERVRCWRPRVYDDGLQIALPSSLRLTARISRSEFRNFATFKEPDYESPGLGELITRQSVKGVAEIIPDYSDRHKVVSAGVARVAARNIFFNARRQYFKGFPLNQTASFRSADSDVAVASRVLIGIHMGPEDCYIPLDNNIVTHSCDNFPIGTSYFYPSPDAFEMIAESNGKRHRFPLRPIPDSGGAVWTCFDKSETEPVTHPLGLPIHTDRTIADNNSNVLLVSSAGWESYTPPGLCTTIENCTGIKGVVSFGKSRNNFIVLASDGVWSLRLNADGGCTVLSKPDNASCTGEYLVTDRFLIYLTKEGVKLFDGTSASLLGTLPSFRGGTDIEASLLDMLPGAQELLNRFCATGEDADVVRLCYDDESGKLLLITTRDDIFGITLPDGKPVYYGNINGSTSPGYLITRPIKTDASASVATAVSVALLGIPAGAESVTCLYVSSDMTRWDPAGAVSGTYLPLECGSQGRFWRIMFVCRHAPDGFLMRFNIIKKQRNT